jgi:hypothetical protein
MGGIFWTLIVSSMYFSDAEGNKVEFPDKRPWFGCCIQDNALIEVVAGWLLAIVFPPS